MKNYIKGCSWLLVLLFCSCDSFLNEYSQDLTYAKTIEDLDEVLIGDGYMKIGYSWMVGLEKNEGLYFSWLHVMDDDIMEHPTGGSALGTVATELSEYYLWGQYPCMVEGKVKEDTDWKRLYKHISTLNVVLSKTKDINGRAEEVERVQGECYFLRGMYYFYLANIYARPYIAATADKEPGIPLKTTEYIEDIYFTRGTLRQTYDRIVEDLNLAAGLLRGKKHSTVYRAGYDATQALLSRVYLYMGQYDKAIGAADSVLQGKYRLLDYNERVALVKTGEYGDVIPVSVTYKDSPETIFSQGGNCFLETGWNTGFMNAANFRVSDALIEVYAKEPGNDLREGDWLGIFGDPYNPDVRRAGKLIAPEDGIVSSECLIRLPEILLNKAEALAMLSRETEAMEAVEELRIRRIDADTYSPLTKRSGKALVELLRDERRRELCFEGHRWFDLRRYAVHSEYPRSETIVHDHYYYNQTTWSREYVGSCRLEKYDAEAAYVIPIPKSVIEYNKGNISDNPVRPEREMFVRF